MQTLTISAQKHVAALAEGLAAGTAVLLKKGQLSRFTREEEGDTVFFSFTAAPDATAERALCLALAHAMSEHILEYREADVVSQLFRGQFAFLDEDVIRAVRRRLPAAFAGEEEARNRRKLVFLSCLQHFLEEGDVNVEGFLQFRLRRYWEYLSFLLIREINEFFRCEARDDLLALLLCGKTEE